MFLEEVIDLNHRSCDGYRDSAHDANLFGRVCDRHAGRAKAVTGL